MAAQEELGSGDYGGLKDMEVPDEIAVPWDDFPRGEVTGIDDPAQKGISNRRASSYIHFASCHR